MPVAARDALTPGNRWILPTEKRPSYDVASRTDTSTFTGPTFSVADTRQVDALLTVTALTGTGVFSIALKLQSTLDGTNWYDVASMPVLTAAGTWSQSFGGSLGNLGRWVATLASSGATPTVSATWSVDTQCRK